MRFHDLVSSFITLLYFSQASLAKKAKTPKTPDPNFECWQCQSPGKHHQNDYYVVLPDGNSYCNVGFKPCKGVSHYTNPSEAPGVTKRPKRGQCQMMLTQYQAGSDPTHANFGAALLDDKVAPMMFTENNTIATGERWTISTPFGPNLDVWFQGSGPNTTIWYHNYFTSVIYSTVSGGTTAVIGTQYANPGLVNRYWTQYPCGPVPS